MPRPAMVTDEWLAEARRAMKHFGIIAPVESLVEEVFCSGVFLKQQLILLGSCEESAAAVCREHGARCVDSPKDPWDVALDFIASVARAKA